MSLIESVLSKTRFGKKDIQNFKSLLEKYDGDKDSILAIKRSMLNFYSNLDESEIEVINNLFANVLEIE